MNPREFFSYLEIGCNVDFAKTNQGRSAYWAAVRKGISIPDLFRLRGFDHWRIRVKDYDLESVRVESQITLLDEIHAIAIECVNAELTAIVAFQGEDFKLNPTQIETDRVTRWWESVAFRLKGLNHDSIAFNLIIETTGQIPDESLNNLYRQCYDAIQAIDPGRVVIVCPNRISSPELLPKLEIPGEHCFVESHFYAAGPSRSNPNKLWVTGSPAEKAPLITKLDLMADFTNRTRTPVWLGAIMSANFGADDGPDPLASDYTVSEQVEFVSWLSGEASRRLIPVAWNSDTKFFDRSTCTWIESMASVVDAIVGGGSG